MEFTIGTDPEFFLQRISDNQFVSASGLFGCSKTNQKEVIFRYGSKRHVIFLQEDNVSLEFATQPQSTRDGFIASVQAGIVKINKLIANNPLTKDCKLSTASWADFKTEELSKHPGSMEMGCDPDLLVYSRGMRQVTIDQMKNRRTCGGHVHVGAPFLVDNLEQCEALVKILDTILGLPAILEEDEVSRTTRRAGYGPYGVFRFKPYGIEYRTPSNYWTFNEKLIGLTYDRVAMALSLLEKGYKPKNPMYFGTYACDPQRAIKELGIPM